MKKNVNILYSTGLCLAILIISVLRVHADTGFNVHPLYLEGEYRGDVSLAVTRDSQGFLWVATDNGLKRYDGYKMRAFKHENNDDTSLGSNLINAIHSGRNGTLWVAGLQLNLYNAEDENFQHFDVSNGRRILAIYEGEKGDLWLGGNDFGLVKFDVEKKSITNTYFEGIKNENIFSISGAHGSNLLWVVTSAGLFKFNLIDNKFEKFTLPDLDLNVASAVEDVRGNLWLASAGEVFSYDIDKHELKEYPIALHESEPVVQNKILSLAADSRGVIWVGTENDGVYHLNPENGKILHIPASVEPKHTFPLAPINTIFEDQEGSIWFSVGSYGIYRISKQFETFSVLKNAPEVSNSLAFNSVTDMIEDSEGNLWFATAGRGLDFYNPTSYEFVHFRHDPNNTNSLASDIVLSLAVDSQGIIWIGTKGGGLNRLNPNSKIIERIEHPQGKDVDVGYIFVEPTGKLLLGMLSFGLQEYNPVTRNFESWRGGNIDDGNLLNTEIRDISYIDDAHYWIVGNYGLELFDVDKNIFTQVVLAGVDLKDEARFNEVYVDKQGVLWLASSVGIIQYSPSTDRAENIVQPGSMDNNYIVSIEQGAGGYLWLGTRDGLSRFNPESHEFLNFKKSDGLASAQHNVGSSLVSRSGYLYFGGVDGISVFNPNNLLSNENTPQVQLTELEIFQTPVIPGPDSVLDKSITQTTQIELEYSQRDITLEFSALNFIFPQNNEYRYRLQGLEKDWIKVSSDRRRVRYTNLEPGAYTFQVLGANNDGVWSGSARELEIIVLPAWWQTIWARILFSIVVVSAIYTFIGWRVRENRRRERELKIIVDEQTAELKKANQAALLLNAELEQRVAHRTRELSVEIEERRVSEAKSQHAAFHDALTGLPNRAWQLDYLNGLIQKSAKKNSKFGMLYIGGDRFKQINDNYGHLLGDNLLVASARRLMDLIDDNCHACRLGSDEFIITVESIESESVLVGIAQNIINAFEKPFDLDGVNLHFYVSIGMLMGSTEYGHATQVLRNANIALRKAKEVGRGVYQMFDSDMLKHTLEIAALEADLKEALKLEELSVVYQPIIEITSGKLNSFEILLRWNHPQRGMVGPDKFIPIAEATGTIYKMGLWVLEQASKQLQEWQLLVGAELLPNISVNLSPIQLSEPGFLDGIEEVFKRTGADKRKIKFEITESAIMEHTDAVDELLESLRDGGFELAIDDFGTGYSSLGYLDKLPVQFLKIDRSFVSALTDSNSEHASAHEIIRATISLAHNLQMRVVAEGIENKGQLSALASYGCDYGQGYLIARPLSPDDATAFLLKAQNSVG